jgi:multiple RNA-binding domain-containing protein 1
VDESDAKLQEFMEVMQPASKSSLWNAKTQQNGTEEPPMKMQAMELPEGESDDEYETVPKKPKKEMSPKPVVAPVVVPIPDVVSAVEQDSMEGISTEPVDGLVATDDDWLRSRTNRLLDLMDPNEIPTATKAPTTSANTQPTVRDAVAETSVPILEQPQAQAEGETSREDDNPTEYKSYDRCH